MSRTSTPMLALVVVASPLLSSGLKLNPDTNPRPAHHIDFEQVHQDWDYVSRHWMTPSEEERPSGELAPIAGAQRRRCGGDICNFHGSSAPALYVVSRTDGLGSRSYSILGGMALAAKHGMNFGGATGVGGTPHGIDTVPAMSALFGTDIRADTPSPSDTVKIGTVGALEDFFEAGNGTHNTSVFLLDCNLQFQLEQYIREKGKQFGDYYTPQFLNHIRRANTLSKHNGGPGKPVVALHVRRGDAIGMSPRMTDDQFYFNMVRAIKKHLPHANVHVFSEGSPTQFVEYQQQGMHLHLDSANVVEAWEYFSTADIVITAKSSFSMVPAFFNPNCVIFQIYPMHPLDEWMIVDPDETTIYDDELEACLHRIKQ